jgi:hypothetical protein
MDRKVLEEEIRMVAYELYVKSGCIPGRDLDNWLEAERIVLAKHGLLSEGKDHPNAPQTEEKPKGKGRRRKQCEETPSCKRGKRKKGE